MIRTIAVAFTLVFLALTSSKSVSSEMIVMLLHDVEGERECHLVESGWTNKDDPLVLKNEELSGYHLDGETGEIGCSVHLTEEEFYEHFHFCALGNIDPISSVDSFGLENCGVRSTTSGFEISEYWDVIWEDSKSGSCQFNCLKR